MSPSLHLHPINVVVYNDPEKSNLVAGFVLRCFQNTASDRTTTGFVDKLNTLNLTNYKLEILNGAHDWYVWRESFTNFVKDHLWTKDVKIETPSETPVIKPETPASSTNTTTAPKTGDDLNLAVAGLFIIISVTTGVVIKKHY